jgi:hypothetical protein
MSDQTVIVWDLETVPDLLAAARMLDLGKAPKEQPYAIFADLESCAIALSAALSPPHTVPLYRPKRSPKTAVLFTLESTKVSIRYFAFKIPAFGLSRTGKSYSGLLNASILRSNLCRPLAPLVIALLAS